MLGHASTIAQRNAGFKSYFIIALYLIRSFNIIKHMLDFAGVKSHSAFPGGAVSGLGMIEVDDGAHSARTLTGGL